MRNKCGMCSDIQLVMLMNYTKGRAAPSYIINPSGNDSYFMVMSSTEFSLTDNKCKIKLIKEYTTVMDDRNK